VQHQFAAGDSADALGVLGRHRGVRLPHSAARDDPLGEDEPDIRQTHRLRYRIDDGRIWAGSGCRCLKRYIGRELYRALTATMAPSKA
jgi:hypothetical protein